MKENDIIEQFYQEEQKKEKEIEEKRKKDQTPKNLWNRFYKIKCFYENWLYKNYKSKYKTNLDNVVEIDGASRTMIITKESFFDKFWSWDIKTKNIIVRFNQEGEVVDVEGEASSKDILILKNNYNHFLKIKNKNALIFLNPKIFLQKISKLFKR